MPMKSRSDQIAGTGKPIARPTRGELLEQIRAVIVEQCGLELENVRPESSLVMDLGIDSLDLVEWK